MIDLISFGGDGLNILFKDSKKVEIRTIKDTAVRFRGRTFEECEGTDFWNITEEEKKILMDNTTLDEVTDITRSIV